MVRAILDGRKTVTRRIVKPQRSGHHWQRLPGYVGDYRHEGDNLWHFSHRIPQNPLLDCDPQIRCPYGQPGDRLWVRETFGFVTHTWDENENPIAWVPDRPATPCRELPFGNGYYSGHVIYAADGHHEWAGDDDGGGEPRSAWKPSIHMPRAASRITLEVTGVRVERLQDGDGEMARESRYLAEGINRIHHGDGAYYYSAFRNEPHPKNWSDPFDAWRELWQSTGGEWDANPWVWAVEFKRIEQERKVA